MYSEYLLIHCNSYTLLTGCSLVLVDYNNIIIIICTGTGKLWQIESIDYNCVLNLHKNVMANTLYSQ